MATSVPTHNTAFTLATRWDAVDALRGVAMVWMTVFHFCFDLNHFGYLRQDFYEDPLWTWQRTGILSLFLATAGLSQAIALQQRQSWQRFWRRWGQVAACALLVTAASYVMYPRSFIYFGTLHGIAIMLFVARLTAGWGRWLWLLGGLAIAGKFVASMALANSGNADWIAALNGRGWNWLGIITAKPVTEDYVPLLPWLGVMWWGMAAGQWLVVKRPAWLAWQPPVHALRVGQAFGGLAVLGRWSLVYYMLHQPVMIGLLSAWKWCAG